VQAYTPVPPTLAYCYIVGQTLEGNPYWDQVIHVRTGLLGWINENWLYHQSQRVHCTL